MLKTKLVLYIMADFETSDIPEGNGVYAWLTGFKVCGLMNTEDKKFIDSSYLGLSKDLKYFYGKKALKQWLESVMEISKICNENNIEVVVFFHNARFDFSYIEYFLLKDCGKYNNKANTYYMNDVVIDENKTFYSCRINNKIRVRNGNGQRKQKTISFTVRDLYKILPSSLADIGDSVGLPKGKDFDYDMVRPYNYIPTKKELEEYFFTDINIMDIAYKQLPTFFYGKYTIGSIVKRYFLENHLININKSDFNQKDFFPSKGEVVEYSYHNNKKEPFGKSDIKDVYKHLLYGYKGGMTIANNKYIGKTVYNDKLPLQYIPLNDKLTIKIKADIFHLDVNSLYPSVMYENRFPIGIPYIIHSDYEVDNTKELEEYLIKEFKENNKKIILDLTIIKGEVKKGKAPLWLKTEYKRTDKNEISQFNGYKAFYETMQLDSEIVTLEEFLLLKENYNLYYRINFATVFNSIEGLFKSFVAELSELKIKYDDDKFLRLCYKLCMNNLYGKFGEKAQKTTLYKDLDSNGNWIQGETKTKNSNYFYPPIAVYVTSYARIKMISFINLVGWNNILYMDTDSLHLIGENLYNKLKENGHVDNTILGKLKLEEICSAEKTISPKKYAYYGYSFKKKKELFSVTCAGLSKQAQVLIKDFNQFHYGLTFIPSNLIENGKVLIKNKLVDIPLNYIPCGKLSMQLVRGGMKLAPCIFSIKTPDIIKLQQTEKFLNNFDLSVNYI